MVQNKKKRAELFLRAISTLILVPLILWIVVLGELYFTIVILLSAILMSAEWAIITKSSNSAKYKIIGPLYILVPCISLLWIRQQDSGADIILSLLIIVWATDIGGYLFGKAIGGWKLAPKISPGKTWAGFFGGITLAIIAGFFRNDAISFSIAISIIAQIGDLVESYFKRQFQVKDSGNLIPGHGGALDAVDGILLVAPMLAIAIYIF